MRARLLLPALSILVCASGPLAPLAAQRVTAMAIETPGNTRMAGVTVCLGTTQDRDRDGIQTTNSEGQALFSDAPNEPLVVTAHKEGFSGVERSIAASSYDRTAILPLVPGSGGPRCPSAGTGGGSDVGTSIGSIGGKGVFRPIDRRRAPAPRVAPAPRIRSFSINRGLAEIRPGEAASLWVTHSGAEPVEYRVSERQSFAGARWETFTVPPRNRPRSSVGAYASRPQYWFPSGTSAGKKTLYFQLRGSQGQRSNIVSDDVEYVTEARLVGHDFAGDQRIAEVLEYAESRGYRFVERRGDGDGLCRARMNLDDIEPVEGNVVADVADFGSGSYYVSQGKNSPAPVVATSGSMICHFRFLQGRQLAPGWQLERVDFSRVVTSYADVNRSRIFVTVPERAEREEGEAGFSVQVNQAGAMKPVIGAGTLLKATITPAYTAVKINRIRLKGPGANWKVAFP